MTKPLPTTDLPLNLQSRVRGIIIMHTPHDMDYTLEIDGPDRQITLCLHDGWQCDIVFDVDTQTVTMCGGLSLGFDEVRQVDKDHKQFWQGACRVTIPPGFVRDWHAAIKAIVIYLQVLRGQ